MPVLRGSQFQRRKRLRRLRFDYDGVRFPVILYFGKLDSPETRCDKSGRMGARTYLGHM